VSTTVVYHTVGDHSVPVIGRNVTEKELAGS
jgi:hypothetical protein